jgi:hypothetical protein
MNKKIDKGFKSTITVYMLFMLSIFCGKQVKADDIITCNKIEVEAAKELIKQHEGEPFYVTKLDSNKQKILGYSSISCYSKHSNRKSITEKEAISCLDADVFDTCTSIKTAVQKPFLHINTLKALVDLFYNMHVGNTAGNKLKTLNLYTAIKQRDKIGVIIAMSDIKMNDRRKKDLIQLLTINL